MSTSVCFLFDKHVFPQVQKILESDSSSEYQILLPNAVLFLGTFFSQNPEIIEKTDRKFNFIRTILKLLEEFAYTKVLMARLKG